MPAPAPRRGAAPRWSQTERRVLAAIAVLALVGAVALLVGRVRQAAADEAQRESGAPQWMVTETVRAAANGQSISAKLALDAPDPDTRAWISSRPRELATLLQISLAQHEPDGRKGAERVRGLAEDVQLRLNEMLEASRVPPVREVVFHDLVISKL